MYRLTMRAKKNPWRGFPNVQHYQTFTLKSHICYHYCGLVGHTRFECEKGDYDRKQAQIRKRNYKNSKSKHPINKEGN